MILAIAAFCVFSVYGADQQQPGKTYLQLSVNGATYYYSEGVFYQYSPNGYVIVKAPVGAVIPALPAGYSQIIVNQKSYYCYQNIYFLPASGGYIVTASPFARSSSAPQQAAPAAAPAQTQTTTTAPSATTTTTTTTTRSAQPVTVVRTATPVIVKPVQPPPVTNPDSQNPIRKLGRGIVNVALGVFEIPINMNDIAIKEGPPQAMSYGLLKGIGFFILRELVGATDAATFLFPLPGTYYAGPSGWGYGPYLLPEWVVR